MGMFGRFREKVVRAHTDSHAAAFVPVLQRELLKTFNGFKTRLAKRDTYFLCRYTKQRLVVLILRPAIALTKCTRR